MAKADHNTQMRQLFVEEYFFNKNERCGGGCMPKGSSRKEKDTIIL